MATYVIYERTTGKIIHTHVQPDDLPPLTKDGLLALIEPGQNRAKLATLVLDPAEIKPERLYRVDPKSKELKAADAKTAAGFGIGAVRSLKSDWPIGPFKITYSREGIADEEER
jgi:hypothetical protein